MSLHLTLIEEIKSFLRKFVTIFTIDLILDKKKTLKHISPHFKINFNRIWIYFI